MKKILISFLISAIASFGAFAQDATTTSDDDLFGGDMSTTVTSDDDLFGVADTSNGDDLFGGDSSDDMFEDASISDEAVGDVSDIFGDDVVRAGGSISASSDVSATWIDPFNADDNNTSEYWLDSVKNAKTAPDLSAKFYVDARPEDNLRVYGSINIDYPFTVDYPVVSEGVTSDYTQTVTRVGSVPLPNLSVPELFTDFSYNDRVFFRFGKHAVNWGTGYFFSPVSDMINTTQIDPENPDDTIEGGISLRSQIVFPGTQNCLWTYVVPQVSDSGDGYVKYTAFAAKYEFLVGDWELGTGAWVGYQNPLRAMLTASGSINNKVTVFGESVFSWGTDKEWSANRDASVADTQFVDFTPVVQATVGGMYTWSSDEKDGGLTLASQYLFDSYAGAESEALLHDATYEIGKLSPRHSLAVNVSKSYLFDNEDLSASLFGLGSINNSFNTDSVTAVAKATVSWNVFDNFSVSAGPSFTWNSQEASGVSDSDVILLATKYGITPDVLKQSFKSKTSFTISATYGGAKF